MGRDRGGTVGTPYATRRASDCHAPSSYEGEHALWGRSWWLPPEDATQHPLEIIHEGVAAERSSGAFMPAEPTRVLGVGALGEKRRPVSGARQQRRHPDQAVVVAEKMSARTAPRIVFGAGDEAGANRVEFDIPCGGECEPVAHDVRSEAPLPEVTAPALSPIDHRRVAPVCFTDGPAQAIGRSGNRNEVDVVSA